MDKVLMVSVGIPVCSILLVILLIVWPTITKPKKCTCPMCSVGEIEYKYYGSVDQFTKITTPCNECGYTKDDFTEDVFWPSAPA